MKTIETPINGRECQSALQDPELQALSRFYRAFNEGNLELLGEIWLTTDEASMDNPLGGIKRGWEEIRSVYEHIFNGPASVYVEFHDYTIHVTRDMFCAVGRERGYFRLGSEKVKLAIRTSRFFRKQDRQWRLLHHHGSIDDPDLLKRYQNAVSAQSARLRKE